MTADLTPDVEAHLARGRDELREEFAEVVPPETVDAVVEESLTSLPEPKLGDFVPVLVHRRARERLKQLAEPRRSRP